MCHKKMLPGKRLSMVLELDLLGYDRGLRRVWTAVTGWQAHGSNDQGMFGGFTEARQGFGNVIGLVKGGDYGLGVMVAMAGTTRSLKV